MFQHVTEPTRKRGKTEPHTLDLLFTNEENMIEGLTIEAPLGKSDHSILRFHFIAEKAISPPKIQTQYHKGDYQAIIDGLNID